MATPTSSGSRRPSRLVTIWGILQLLRLYLARPRPDPLFDCVDWPVVRADEYQGENAKVIR
jgi:hypothetical protein